MEDFLYLLMALQLLVSKILFFLSIFLKFSHFVAGSVSATSFTSTSDRRLKSNVQPLDTKVVRDLQYLSGVRFTWSDPNLSGLKKEQIGFIAQDVQKLFPSLVDGPELEEDGYYSINYQGFVPLLVEGVKLVTMEAKSLSQSISDLQHVVDDDRKSFTDGIESLSRRMDAIEKSTFEIMERLESIGTE